jgi:hypothetical protein
VDSTVPLRKARARRPSEGVKCTEEGLMWRAPEPQPLTTFYRFQKLAGLLYL